MSNNIPWMCSKIYNIEYFSATKRHLHSKKNKKNGQKWDNLWSHAIFYECHFENWIAFYCTAMLISIQLIASARHTSPALKPYENGASLCRRRGGWERSMPHGSISLGLFVLLMSCVVARHSCLLFGSVKLIWQSSEWWEASAVTNN